MNNLAVITPLKGERGEMIFTGDCIDWSCIQTHVQATVVARTLDACGLFDSNS